MAIDIYVLNKNLKPVGIVDGYNSLIWANRYSALGDCELYLPASEAALNLLQDGFYLARADDDMICRISKHGITTDEDAGDFLTVTGQDARCLLRQRIIYGTVTASGYLETFIRSLVTDNIINPENANRRMLKDNDDPLVVLDAPAGLPDVITGQLSWENVGKQIEAYCSAYKYGARMRYDMGAGVLRFGMYKGVDRSGEVVFSERFDNLSSTKYDSDASGITNVAVVGGTGSGSLKATGEYGTAYGVDRYESFFDAKEITKEITWGELISLYPTEDQGGTGYITQRHSRYVYNLGVLDVQIMSDYHLQALRIEYPAGTVVYIDGAMYYRMTGVYVADLPSQEPAASDTVTLKNIIYSVYLMTKGLESLKGKTVSFEAHVIPGVTFRYREDYSVGDIVTIESGYGVTAHARIVEVIESYDDSGYKLEPKLEYLDLTEGKPAGAGDLLTESGAEILTQEGNVLQTE